MTHNLTYGGKVSHILNSNQVWAEFRDQKHDLFITESTTRGYLTGKTIAFLSIKFNISVLMTDFILGVAPTAGYLTQGPSKNVEVVTSPPPIDRDDPLARNNDDVWDSFNINADISKQEEIKETN